MPDPGTVKKEPERQMLELVLYKIGRTIGAYPAAFYAFGFILNRRPLITTHPLCTVRQLRSGSRQLGSGSRQLRS